MSINLFPETWATAVEERERSQRRSLTASDSSRRTSCPAGRWHIEFGTLSLKWKHYFYRLMLRKIWKLTRVMRKRGEFWTTGWQPPPRSPPTATQSPAPLHRSFAPMMDLPMPHAEDSLDKSLQYCTSNRQEPNFSKICQSFNCKIEIWFETSPYIWMLAIT